MKHVLYISPYFAPQTRVGALRPLKFTRHLATHGWRAVVLTDCKRDDAIDPVLDASVGAGTIVARDYGWFQSGSKGSSQRTSSREGGLRVPAINPELVPLGAHALDVPKALAAAWRLLERHPCDAVLVNADPFAALLVGAIVAEHTSLPLLADLRDPWAPCELRRRLRPAPQRWLVDKLERFVVERATRVILNTEHARQAYLAHYPDLPTPRFVTLHNHVDVALIDRQDVSDESEVPTLLYLGSFRRFVEGDALFALLAELRRRGHGPDRLRLRIVGDVPAAIRHRARALDGIEWRASLPLGATMAAMRSADVLVADAHAGRQRIPAKLFDYLASPRPVVAFSDNPEVAALLERAGSAWAFGHHEVARAADVVETLIAERREVARAPLGITSAEATAKLAAWLDEASGGRSPRGGWSGSG